MSEERLNKLKKLYDKLDVNLDSSINIKELYQAVSLKHSKHSIFFNEDKFIDFNHFHQYCQSRKDDIQIVFNGIDLDENVTISKDIIKTIFREFDIYLEDSEAGYLVERIDTNGQLHITWEEWKDFLMIHPIQCMQEIQNFWLHGNFLDGGSDWIVPDQFESGKGGLSSVHMKISMCGGLAGVLSRTFTAPFDRVKVMLQVHGYKHSNSGIIQSVRYMVNEGGFFSLWRGNGINVFKIAPETAIKYTLFEYYKSVIQDVTGSAKKSDLTLYHRFLAGSMAGMSAQSFIYPLETIKTRLTLRKTGQFRSILDCAKFMYQEGGVRPFYRGFGINAVGILPYAGIDLALYEFSKMTYNERFNRDGTCPPSPLLVPLFSSFSATCGILVTYPLALVRTKLQSKTHFDEPGINNVRGLCRTIWTTAGIRGFYRGLTANLCKCLPASSISYFTFESLNRYFDLQALGNN